MVQAPPCLRRVQSLEEYLGAVEAAFAALSDPPAGGPCELWFRGQAQAGFHLVPAIARSGRRPALEPVYLSKFRSLCIPQLPSVPAAPAPGGPSPYWSWLFLMQHHGVPTRLLDWSRDALTALFFATDPTDPARQRGLDGAVWVLNPARLNQGFPFRCGHIPNVEDRSFQRLFGPGRGRRHADRPAAAVGPLNSARVIAQRAVVTVFPQTPPTTALELREGSEAYLAKICVAWEGADLLQARLQRCGLTRLALFPEIEQVAGDLARQMDEEVRRSGA